MSRTYGGQVFTCKVCGYEHLIPYECKPDHNFKTIEIPCLSHPNDYRKYRGYELRRWVGLRFVYVENRVKPRGFYDEDPNFPE